MSDKKKNFLSKAWYEKLVHESHLLKTEDLPATLLQIKEAKEAWDLSENSEYHAAKEKQWLIQARIDEIESMLEGVEILETDVSKWSADSTVSYGSTVTLEMEDGKQYTFMIVWSGEVNVVDDDMKISFESPIGMAIEGKKVGDTVRVRLASGRKNASILSIK